MAEQTTPSRPLVCMRTTRPAPLQAARRRCSAAPSAPPIRPSPPPARIKSPPIAAPRSGRRAAIAALSAAATAPPPHPPPLPSPSPPLPLPPGLHRLRRIVHNIMPSPLIAAPRSGRRGAVPVQSAPATQHNSFSEQPADAPGPAGRGSLPPPNHHIRPHPAPHTPLPRQGITPGHACNQQAKRGSNKQNAAHLVPRGLQLRVLACHGRRIPHQHLVLHLLVRIAVSTRSADELAPVRRKAPRILLRSTHFVRLHRVGKSRAV